MLRGRIGDACLKTLWACRAGTDGMFYKAWLVFIKFCGACGSVQVLLPATEATCLLFIVVPTRFASTL
jgi:hypothetical protein